MDRRQSPSRAGFTLIEVLIAVLIVATLVALLLPAVRGAFRKAQESQVSAELNNLATALASFKNTYGDFPPSRVILCESGYDSLPAAFLDATVGSSAATAIFPQQPLAAAQTDITNRQLMQRSLLYLRRFWPRCNFNAIPSPLQVTNHQYNDFDGNAAPLPNPNPIILSGSECLVFFLGGLPTYGDTSSGTITGTSGFSKLPLYPFVNSSFSQNRSVANYEFNSGRLKDLDGDGFPSYIDPIDVATTVRPYAYFSSYGTNSFDPNDDNGNGLLSTDGLEVEEDQSTLVERGFSVGFPVYDSSTMVQALATSPGPNPYTTSAPVPTTGTVNWINPNSFQLFSSGQDRFWGIGGQYAQGNLGSTGRLPIYPAPPGGPPSDSGNIHSDDTTGVRRRESDNLTNFSGGRLD